MLWGTIIKGKIELLLKILSAHLQIKFFLIALVGLLINIARFWIDVKKSHAPQKVRTITKPWSLFYICMFDFWLRICYQNNIPFWYLGFSLVCFISNKQNLPNNRLFIMNMHITSIITRIMEMIGIKKVPTGKGRWMALMTITSVKSQVITKQLCWTTMIISIIIHTSLSMTHIIWLLENKLSANI